MSCIMPAPSTHDDLTGFNFKYIPPCGDKISPFGEITRGIWVFELGENSKFFTNATRPTRACIIPNLNPMQFLGPKK